VAEWHALLLQQSWDDFERETTGCHKGFEVWEMVKQLLFSPSLRIQSN